MKVVNDLHKYFKENDWKQLKGTGVAQVVNYIEENTGAVYQSRRKKINSLHQKGKYLVIWDFDGRESISLLFLNLENSDMRTYTNRHVSSLVDIFKRLNVAEGYFYVIHEKADFLVELKKLLSFIPETK